MNYKKYKQIRNQQKKRMYTPDGYLKDPEDATCPYCGESKKSCSYVNSLSRAWARHACKQRNGK